MALFPRNFANDYESSFTPLFRLLEDYDTYTNPRNSNNKNNRGSNIMKSFNPKFDVKEIAEAYELHGELPGIDQKDVHIEFVDGQTLQVKGHVERSYQKGTPPSAAIEGSKTAAIEDKKYHAHQPTVEDEDAAEGGVSTEVQVAKSVKPAEPEVKYWVSERSIGEFSRSFTFPITVDQNAVKASMKNGILSVVVPKAKKHEGRKIMIE